MILLSLLLWCWLQLIVTTEAQWSKPNARLPNFSDTYIVGERIFVSWLHLNDSVNDLWLTRYDTTNSNFSLRIAVSQNISIPASADWTIALDEKEVLEDTRFILQFLPQGTSYHVDAELSLASPAFNVILVNQASPPNGSVTATGPASVSQTSTSANASPSTNERESPSPTASPPPNSFGLNQTTKVAIGVGVAVIALFLGSVTAFIMIRRQRLRQKAQLKVEQEANGPYEVLGDKRLPVELNDKETAIHELNSSRETSVSEADSSSIHEMATIVKKPGLHELPG